MVIKYPAIFFDRDGVITKMIPRSNGEYTAPWTREEFHILPRVQEAFELVVPRYKCFVVTNQPDVLLGHMKREDLEWMHHILFTELPLVQIIQAEERGSAQYKPNPGMVQHLIRTYDLDIERSWMIGDRWKDIVCGYRAGVKTIFTGSKYDHGGSEINPDVIVGDIYEACHYIMNR